MAPSSKVFGIYELLEQILLHLPLREQLLSQKINKAASDVVKCSPNIRKTLFLLPSASIVHSEVAGRDYVWKEEDGIKCKTPVFNPFLTIRNAAERVNTCQARRERLLDDKDVVFVASTGFERHGRALLCRRRYEYCTYGSQAEMLITHPPILKVRMFVRMNRNEKAVGGGSGGVTYHEAIVAAQSAATNSRQKKKVRMHWLPETSSWLRFRGTVDTITGFEMLDMLEMDTEGLMKDGSVFHKESKENRCEP